MVPETEDQYPFFLNPFRSNSIVCQLFVSGMSATVQLNSKMRIVTIKVQDVGKHRTLTTKF